MHDTLTPPRPLPDSQDWYLAYDNFHMDHYVLYHGLNKSIQYARGADVLMIGNSRMQFAFSHTLLKRAASETGLRFYNLAFGHGEKSKFFLDLIEKHELRPKIVIVNAGAFFRPYASEFGERVMKSSRWEAWKTVWEWSLASRIRRFTLLEWLPDWRKLSPGWYPELEWIIIYRSISLGSWFSYRERPMRIPIGMPPANVFEGFDEVDAETLSIARDFKYALAEFGADLVLTWIPYPGMWHERREVASLADALEVPFISPVIEGLITRDDEHLNDESAECFGTQFITEFKAWLKKSGAGDD